jgi:GGDEF domain-containing protein
LAFRCGGDEFGVVLPGTTLVGAMRTGRKDSPESAGESQILLSLGYSCPLTVTITRDGDEAEVRQRLSAPAVNPDQALYASKRSSKNCARAFSA